MLQINWLAVISATFSCFLLGGLWYSPILLGKAWMKVNGFTPEKVNQGNKVKLFAFAILLAFVMAVNLFMFLNGTPGLNVVMGTIYGALSGVWIFCGIGIVALFEQRSWLYILINGGYSLLAMACMGAIIGAWN